MNKHIQLLKESIGPVRERLIAHPIYHSIQGPAALRIFMEHHVYAVWDFMSLLKSLQQALTCVETPWIPRGSANTRYLINEIVVGEESDVDERGQRTSHFELYLRAMEESGASVLPIGRLIRVLGEGVPVRSAISSQVNVGSIRDFLDFTFDTIGAGQIHGIASVFTFGREDLIPDMFLQIVRDLSQETAGSFSIFTWYLERHIEVDGGHHSHLAMEMLEDLCGDDETKWQEATHAAIGAIEARIRLWDGVVAAIRQQTATATAELAG